MLQRDIVDIVLAIFEKVRIQSSNNRHHSLNARFCSMATYLMLAGIPIIATLQNDYPGDKILKVHDSDIVDCLLGVSMHEVTKKCGFVRLGVSRLFIRDGPCLVPISHHASFLMSESVGANALIRSCIISSQVESNGSAPVFRILSMESTRRALGRSSEELLSSLNIYPAFVGPFIQGNFNERLAVLKGAASSREALVVKDIFCLCLILSYSLRRMVPFSHMDLIVQCLTYLKYVFLLPRRYLRCAAS